MLLNLAKDDLYLLLPSDFGADVRVLVEAVLLNEGIMEVFIVFTLAERASEACVGVVMALGRFVDVTAGFAGVDGAPSFSRLLSRDNGRAVDVSSLISFLTRLLGAVFSGRPVSPIVRRDFVDVDLGSFVSRLDSSKPAFELLRFSEDTLVCILVFHVEG